ncbi:hypothetical protein BOTBODRAFT_108216 [Botryobasidium botryosum FD-172 SS1]|uniref:AAA+ ATPase domain-containing protein n=1 Tax=Botryobasidium botryosum (strain FD-172 SS1) TaxID=930990 RepID=A0A067MJH9_BOTB1|nr:hypothetical protein BOTBODRAFT_108216 [Botryobasidium botryosum FD-172 SS1]
MSTHSSFVSATTPSRPLLFFAMGSDTPAEVERLLVTGEADANERAGPQDLPALVFALTNDQLEHKTEIVKTLLAHGADPAVVEHLASSSPDSADSDDESDSPLAVKVKEAMNPAIRYYLGRQLPVPIRQQELLKEAGFESLLRARFCIVGQDHALNELVRAIAIQCRQRKMKPLSIIFSGPSGHGKSLLASKVGNLLNVPAHTVNMTNLRTQEELLRARSLSTTEDDSTLEDFLTRNGDKRCVVVLEEIEKAAEKLVLNSLLIPWELGVLSSPNPHDTSHVIWICTSNIGENLAFEYHSNHPEGPSSREEYLALMTIVRRYMGESLGTSLVSRVTAVLPFLPFQPQEQLALASESLSAVQQEMSASAFSPPTARMSAAETETLLRQAVEDYIPREGARSIQRAVQARYEDDLW